MIMFEGINWLAVLAAAVSAFLLGGIWYGPLFKHAWCRENGMDPNAPPQGHPAKVFGTAFVAALIAAAAFGEGLRVAGIVLNDTGPAAMEDPSRATNHAELAARAVPPVLGTVAWEAQRIEPHVDWWKLAGGE